MTITQKEVPSTWTTGWTDVFNTGTWRSAIPVHSYRRSPCHNSCPVHGEIPLWVQYLVKEEYKKAWDILSFNNPMPGVTGRVCHHPCELACNRQEFDERVSVKALERFLGDYALSSGWSLPVNNNTSKPKGKVAIIGGGPSGLSAAYHLKLKGYNPTVYEERPFLGGMARYGIPAYRLPQHILHQEIDRLLETGITVNLNTPVKKQDDFKDLQKNFDAVFLAIGANTPQQLPFQQEKENLIVDGLGFLENVNKNEARSTGNNVAVIGGGNTAIDAARTAKRMGSENVSVIYRREMEQMPAQKEEIEEAQEEGINFIFLLSPVKVEGENEVESLVCQKMHLSEQDVSGRLKPEPVPGAYVTLNVDTVISAIGSVPDSTFVQKLIKTAQGNIVVDENTCTDKKGVFAGGDATRQDRFVSIALGDGKRAAESIDKLLDNTENKNAEKANENITENSEVKFQEINTFYFSPSTATAVGRIDLEQRKNSFAEVQIPLSEHEAIYEAKRCFNCGYCVECDNCFYFCPDMAVKPADDPEKKYEILDQYCKGCGLCAAECPRGVILLEEEIR